MWSTIIGAIVSIISNWIGAKQTVAAQTKADALTESAATVGAAMEIEAERRAIISGNRDGTYEGERRVNGGVTVVWNGKAWVAVDANVTTSDIFGDAAGGY